MKAVSGILVLLIVLFVFLYLSAGFHIFERKECYHVYAYFDSVAGLSVGSNVMISGIKVGKVDEILLEDLSSSVKVDLCLNDALKIPSDSVATIAYANLFSGERYVNIDVGAEEDYIKSGDRFIHSRGSLNLEEILRRFISNAINK